MKKTTPYARKMARKHGAGWRDVEPDKWAALVVLEGSRPYDEEQGTPALIDKASATSARGKIIGALDDMLAHRVAPDDDRPYKLLAHAIDVAHIRYVQIQPGEDNPAHAPLLAAKGVMHEILQRRYRTGRWGLSGPERAVLQEAVDLYEAVLASSSPKQMDLAVEIREEAIRKGHFWTTQQKKGGT